MNTVILYFASGKVNENIKECEKQLFTLFNQLGTPIPESQYCKAYEDLLTDAVKVLTANNKTVILCGDPQLSKKVINKAYHLTEEICDEYKNLLVRRSVAFSDEDLYFPTGSKVKLCRENCDCAFCIKVSGKTFFALPGNPDSLKTLTDELIVPYYAEEMGINLSRTTIKLFGTSLDELNKVISVIKSNYPVKFQIDDNFGNISLNISACASSVDDADKACYSAISEIKNHFSDCLYEIGSRSLSEITVDALKRKGLTVSTAESCTGGMLSEAITSISGSSSVLEMGVCAYSNRIKTEIVGVSESIISSFGAVSKETAAALAKGIRNKSGADLGIGITGVAGPDSSEGKAVGSVYVALCDKEKLWVRLISLPETLSRDEIREHATFTALDLIRRYISCLPDFMAGASTEESIIVLSAQPTLDSFTAEKQINEEKAREEKPTPVYVDDQASSIVLADDFGDEELIEADDSHTLDFADFIHEDYGNKKNSDDDSPEIASENYNDDIGIITEQDDFENEELTFKPSKAAKTVKIAFITVIALLLVAAIIFGSFFGKIYRDLSLINDAREVYSSNALPQAFDTLKAQNSDFLAWLNIYGTEINNPVYQTSDNTYYTTHNMNRQKSRYGALFFDYRNVVEGNGAASNLTVYGQNMNDGSMFGALNNYQSLAFLNSNSDITLTTSSGKASYKVFAVIITNASKEQDNGHYFDFSRQSFDNIASFMSWVQEAKEKSLYITDLQLGFDDSLLTLVTTSDAFENARLVVIAKKSESGDSTATYAVNPSPVYPKAWYDKRGLEGGNSSSMTGAEVSSGNESDEASSNDSSSEESSSSESPSSSQRPNTPSRPTPSTPSNPSTPSDPSTPSSSENDSSEESSSDDGSSEESASEGGSSEGNDSSSNPSDGNSSENTTTEQSPSSSETTE